jgi:hypothetical protein
LFWCTWQECHIAEAVAFAHRNHGNTTSSRDSRNHMHSSIVAVLHIYYFRKNNNVSTQLNWQHHKHLLMDCQHSTSSGHRQATVDQWQWTANAHCVRMFRNSASLTATRTVNSCGQALSTLPGLVTTL